MSSRRRQVLVVPLPGNEVAGHEIAETLSGALAIPAVRRFPDEETYARLDASVEGCDVVLVATLDRPDSKVLSVLFLADLVRDLGARRCVLVAPYLAYMRQDTRFRPGEAVTSRSFARVLSAACDGLVTVDPHLHRYSSLADLYTVPTRVVHAAALLSEWIRLSVKDPVLIGPDSESEQWVAEVARLAGAPFVVLQKTRHGDREVEISVPDVERWISRRPVLVDDIISTARTMSETIGHLHQAGLAPPVCIGVHALFAGDAYRHLSSAGVERIVTTDTVSHETNAIGVGHALAEAVADLVG